MANWQPDLNSDIENWSRARLTSKYNWKDDYRSKLTTYEAVASKIQSGDFIVNSVGPGSVDPEAFLEIFKRSDELENIVISDSVAARLYPWVDADLMSKLEDERGWKISSAYLTPATRGLGQKHRVDYMPTAAWDSATRSALRTNVYFLQVTPPNENGYINFGLVGFYAPTFFKVGRENEMRMIVGEVNENMPVVYGPEQWVHVSEFDYFVEKNSVLLTTQREAPGELEQTIGNYVTELIEDGCTLQMGWGGITEAVVANLEGFHDIGVHSEMFPAGLQNLVKKGIVNNSKKPIFTGQSVAAFALGDQELYDYLKENHEVAMVRSEITNSIPVVCGLPKMLCLNGALMINMMGEVAAHGLGGKIISGPGGQLEFMSGAQYSPGGKGVNLMASARKDKDGNLLSNIVVDFPEGTPVTIPAVFSDYVITEYGIAHLRYLDHHERARELIRIAHPDLRGELRASMKKSFYPGYDPSRAQVYK